MSALSLGGVQARLRAVAAAGLCDWCVSCGGRQQAEETGTAGRATSGSTKGCMDASACALVAEGPGTAARCLACVAYCYRQQQCVCTPTHMQGQSMRVRRLAAPYAAGCAESAMPWWGAGAHFGMRSASHRTCGAHVAPTSVGAVSLSACPCSRCCTSSVLRMQAACTACMHVS